MIRLEVCKLTLGTTVLRFYLMMAAVIVAGFTGYWLIGLLALPIFASALLGVTIKFGNKKELVANKQLAKEQLRKAA